MGKNKAARKAAPDFESRTYESLMAAARAAKTIEQKRSVLIQLNQVTANLTQKDIATWRSAWQMALNVENPKRGRLYDCYTDALIAGRQDPAKEIRAENRGRERGRYGNEDFRAPMVRGLRELCA